MNLSVLIVAAVLYCGAILYLGYRGYRATHSCSDYLVAGRQVHPLIMAASYSATFISTSAIVGYGGASALFGIGIVWVDALIILLGVLVGFLVFGRRIRRMGRRLDAQTFPELLGLRFESRFVQGAVGLIVMLFMPLYTAAVLTGAARYVETTFRINYALALGLLSVLVAGYVIVGGLKSVMYTDALQAVLMYGGLLSLVVLTYAQLGGVAEAHRRLEALPEAVDATAQAALPEVAAIAPDGVSGEEAFGWLVARAGMLKQAAGMDAAERAALMQAHPELKAVGELLERHPVLWSKMVLSQLERAGFRGWMHLPRAGSPMFYVWLTTLLFGMSIGMLAQPQLAVRFMTVRNDRQICRATLAATLFFLVMAGVLMVGLLSNVWFAMPEHGGKITLASVPGGNIDAVIPDFVNRALPSWFGAVFMLTLLSAAMSTLSSQFHVMGTSFGRDFLEQGILGRRPHSHTVALARAGILASVLATVALSFLLPPGIVALATAIFAGLCAAAFLPMLVGALFWRRMTRQGAIASLMVGAGLGLFWLMFVQMPNAKLPALLAHALLGKPTLLPVPIAGIHWNWVDAVMVALPISAAAAVVVSLLTKPQSAAYVAHCFAGGEEE